MCGQSQISDRKFHIIAMLVLTAVYIGAYLLPLGGRDLMRPDEFRYGEIPREMLERGDWNVPLIVGVRYFEKPALGYQWTALALKLFGENAFAVRFPAAFSVGLAALLVYILCAKANRDRWLAPLASSIYLSFALVFGVGSFAVLDSQLTMALTWCIGGYCLMCQASKFSGRFFWLLIAGLAAGAAFLFKGFLAFAVPVAVIVPYLIWQKDWKKFLTTPWLPLAAAVVVALPWSIAVWKAEPDFWNYFFIEEHIKRFTSGTYDRSPEPFWFYLPVFLGGMMPGGLLLLSSWRGFSKEFLREPLVRFALCWTVMPLILFSVSSCKVGTYILPCFPGLAILIAWSLLEALKKAPEVTARWLGRGITFLWWLIAIAGIAGLVMLILWRLLWVEKLPVFNPMNILPLVLALVTALCGVWGSCWRKKHILWQLCAWLLVFVFLCGCGNGVLFNWRMNPDKMPERALREAFAEMEVSAQDVVAVDRSAATPAAWILHRTDLVVIGSQGEFQYGFNKYPQEYAGRYYTFKELPELLKASGNRRVIYVRMRTLEDKPAPKTLQFKKIISRKGITVAELAK